MYHSNKSTSLPTKGVTVIILAIHRDTVDIEMKDYWNVNGKKLPHGTYTIPLADCLENLAEHGIVNPVVGIPYVTTE